MPPLCLVLAGLMFPAQTPASDATPPLVKRAISTYTAEHRGDLGFSRHLSFSLKIGPISHDVRNEIGILMRDGAYVRVHYYDASTNGKPEDSAELKREEDKANADLAAGKGFLKRPVDARFADDYRFASATCDECSPSDEAFAFTSTVHDTQHAHGTVVIDAATARVQRLEYTLERPPARASSADGVETFGEPMPGLWTCVRVEETYHGKLGLVGGTATMTYTLDHFRRFAQLESGLAALSEGTL